MTPPQARQLTLDGVDGSAPLERSTQPKEGRAPERERKPTVETTPAPRGAAGRVPGATPGRVRWSRDGGGANGRGETAPDLGLVGVAPPRSLLTADQVAVKLGMDKEWIWEQSRRGRIPTIRLGRFYRYREDAIDAWLASIERGSVQQSVKD